MNWKHLSLAALLGLSLVACDSKKEEKKTDGTAKVEEHKAGEVKPAETPKEEHKEEKKAS